MARSRLVPVGEETAELLAGEQSESAPSASTERALGSLLLTLLTTLSKRTIVALASLVDLALIASAFTIWLLIISNPTILQLIGAGEYAGLVLLALFMRRRG